MGRSRVRNPVSWKGRFPAVALALSFSITLALVALANFIVNPFAIYSTNLVDRTGANFRKQKYGILKRFMYEPDAIILGSSRAMTMRTDDVSTRIPAHCFNFAVPSSTAEDYYAALMLVTDDLGSCINTVALAVDFEAFNPAEPLQSEIEFFPKYAHYLSLTPEAKVSFARKLTLLLSYEQTDESIKALNRAIRKKSGILKIKLLPNGSVVQVEREKEIANGTFDLEKLLKKRVRKYPERSLKLSKYTKLDERRLKYLDLFFDVCESQGIKVYAYITPYHPELWTVLDSHPNRKMLDIVKARLVEIFADHGITLHDFSHIESFGGDPTRFYDEIHPMPDTQAKILDALFAAEGVLRKPRTERDAGLTGNDAAAPGEGGERRDR